ncbi:hypothetical protein QR680_005476 [Steinernema hermaphroditum]|uniref:oxaloacetate tautomerase n=1 Tax=Steinernema hermaphroditum TaxID=289476 RepID=A0AA39LVG2_9BILA|nr:hypothetical protein QR680_005476 [Steinernema hermaphroditum]
MEDLENFHAICKTVVGLENNFRCFLKEQSLSEGDFPIWFKRSGGNIISEGTHITIPAGHLGLVAEVHLGVVLSKDTSEISRSEVKHHIGGFVVALNLHIRDEPFKKTPSKVWAESQEFHSDIAVSSLLHNIEHPHTLSIWSAVNGTEVQRGLLADAIRSIPDVVERASELTSLRKGDIVLCGTPTGGRYVKAGDVVEIGIDDHVRCQFNVEKFTDVSAPTGAYHF